MDDTLKLVREFRVSLLLCIVETQLTGGNTGDGDSVGTLRFRNVLDVGGILVGRSRDANRTTMRLGDATHTTSTRREPGNTDTTTSPSNEVEVN